ncbi:uncharacterized protein EV420DRAFT_1620828 [Desarmillaria tabescens]|uniref:DNA breaking-rejoining enzyme n=1 Tax=Armillaria tabescens TaxID=1929756 RepID=A0AA39KBC7_ARMTA|nr:uncharacterized protein EV420DRAFT_1620828 [Desarmillaria tabescens]KAK0457945.1 hypothetical protein EV420DRAFT_1620828 [Desarmillaria tabescens]
MAEIMDDIEGEQETCPDSYSYDGDGDIDIDIDVSAHNEVDEVLATIQGASKGVKEGTDTAYRGYCLTISALSCDEFNMHGIDKDPKDIQMSYSYAQKLRAGTTYGFRKTRGRLPWNQDTASGNPSISELVSSYMLSLHKRKDILRKLYEFNHQPENWDNSQPSADNWCGGNMRRLLQAVYLVAFSCLLCVDEVLNIQVHDIRFYIDEADNMHCASISLPFRKTSQFGKIQPFVLRMLLADMAHLCPVRALAEWISASEILHGYLFRKMDKRDRPIVVKNSPMTPEVFLELFRNNLWDLRIAPYAYGTHSFRRGGCQWLSVDLRWSKEFTHLTIVKYLISWNDNPMLRCDEFFKLDHQTTIQC